MSHHQPARGGINTAENFLTEIDAQTTPCHGDAVCTFNPIYGQGMSVVALQRPALRRHRARPEGPRRLEFLREVGRIVDLPWGMASGGDRSLESRAGARSRCVCWVRT
jgi:hypothetical protein